VNERISRLRRFFRERWAAQIAALGVFALVAAGVVAWWRARLLRPEMVPERVVHVPETFEKAQVLRERALTQCAAHAFDECLKGLDEARALDPVGDQAEAVHTARAAARDALSPKPPEPIVPAP